MWVGNPSPEQRQTTTVATTAPAIASSVARSTCWSRRCPSSCATTSRSSAGDASASNVSDNTTRRVRPRPDTYAFAFRVRRLASTTSTFPIGTPPAPPARAAPLPAARQAAARIG